MTNTLNQGTLPQQMFSANPGPPQSVDPSKTNRGVCSLTFKEREFQFRTNPNEIWWTYELVRNVEQTYGGRVVQLLGTRLGDLQVKVECGAGGWPYLMKVVLFLRDMLSDQRGGDTAVFEYTTRNWRMKVYGMTIPFQDEVEATTRELTLNFKIQEDVTGVLSQITLNAEILRLQDGVYGGTVDPHNRYDDPFSQDAAAPTDAINPSGPSYNASNITNNVGSSILGSFPGASLFGSFGI